MGAASMADSSLQSSNPVSVRNLTQEEEEDRMLAQALQESERLARQQGQSQAAGGDRDKHPYPQETTPDSSDPHMKGPPESPWQESLPPSSGSVQGCLPRRWYPIQTRYTQFRQNIPSRQR